MSRKEKEGFMESGSKELHDFFEVLLKDKANQVLQRPLFCTTN